MGAAWGYLMGNYFVEQAYNEVEYRNIKQFATQEFPGNDLLVISTANISVGDEVFGINIPIGAKVDTIYSSTRLALTEISLSRVNSVITFVCKSTPTIMLELNARPIDGDRLYDYVNSYAMTTPITFDLTTINAVGNVNYSIDSIEILPHKGVSAGNINVSLNGNELVITPDTYVFGDVSVDVKATDENNNSCIEGVSPGYSLLGPYNITITNQAIDDHYFTLDTSNPNYNVVWNLLQYTSNIPIELQYPIGAARVISNNTDPEFNSNSKIYYSGSDVLNTFSWTNMPEDSISLSDMFVGTTWQVYLELDATYMSNRSNNSPYWRICYIKQVSASWEELDLSTMQWTQGNWDGSLVVTGMPGQLLADLASVESYPQVSKLQNATKIKVTYSSPYNVHLAVGAYGTATTFNLGIIESGQEYTLPTPNWVGSYRLDFQELTAYSAFSISKIEVYTS